MEIVKVILIFLIRRGVDGLDNIGINVVDSLAQVVMTFHIQRIFHSVRMAQRNLLVLTPTPHRNFGTLVPVA